MSKEIEALNFLAERAVQRENESSQRLPSTLVNQQEIGWDQEEIHLRDYLEVLARRKWLIIAFLMLSFISTLVLTLAATKTYKASVVIQVSPQNQNVTKFEEVVSSDMRAREFYETQVSLIKSHGLLQRVAEELDLEVHPVIIKTLFDNSAPGPLARAKDWIRGLVVSLIPRAEKKSAGNNGVIAAQTLKHRKLLAYIAHNLTVEPSRTSMLMTVSFTSPDRWLSKDVVNTLATEFLNWKMEKKLDASRLAREYLMKQIDRSKIDLEKAEEEHNRFAKIAGIVSLDSKLNSVYRQLEELNTVLAEAEADLIKKEAVFQQARLDGASHLPQVMESTIIAWLKTDYARVRSEYEDLSVTFHEAYPAVKELKVKMESLAERIQAEEEKIGFTLENEYKTTLMRTETLRKRLASQQQLAMTLNEKAVQFKIMAREVQTNKEIYQSLLERAKEIESMVGVSSNNIQIVDQALLPLLPFKPNLKRNLLLAIALGLMGGVGLAFLLEYFNDSVTNPDEIAERFQIPILGIAPIGRAEGYPVERSFFYDPRAPLSEALRTTRVSIQLAGTEAQTKSILITSTQPSEGKTTLAANLALTFAGAGENVVLVDADMRKPRIHKVFDSDQLRRSPGLSSFLAGGKKDNLIASNGVPRLSMIPAGPIPPNPVELLASDRFKKLIRDLETQFDRVIMDSPPQMGFADTLIMAQHVGGVVLVSSLGDTKRDALRYFRRTMSNAHGTLLGCIVNKVNINKRYGYSSYYQYYGDYGDGKKGKLPAVVDDGDNSY